jgi:succinate dehydrogenase / fumarate reductase iron-sulfur subunit
VNLKLNVWRQKDADAEGQMEAYDATDVSPDMSFLEMLDEVNEKLLKDGKDPIAFDHDCREGICGSCAMNVNGVPHGPQKGTTVCQLHMRHFNDGDAITVEPFRAKPFPVIKDLVINRSSFDRINQAGGFISVNTGGAPDANALPVSKHNADQAFDAAACIACGACVAGCKNGSAMLYTAAKVSHLALLPQGDPERGTRVLKMIKAMDEEGFGACSNQYECEAVCPKNISVRNIARLYREYMRASLLEG